MIGQRVHDLPLTGQNGDRRSKAKDGRRTVGARGLRHIVQAERAGVSCD